jgi:hypothetical protein
MPFALCPDDGPPRLWRFVPDGLPDEVVSLLDVEQNILTIDRSKFDQLPELQRHMVLRTHSRYTFVR